MLKKPLLITILFLILFTESVIAVPKTKDPKPKPPKLPKNSKTAPIIFTEKATLGAGNIYLGNQKITETGSLHIQDAVSIGTIDKGYTPISGFKIETCLSGTLDLATYFGSYGGKWIITGHSGTFEGTITGKVEVATIFGKFVGHGTGDFEGQKIKGTFKGSVNYFQVEISIEATISSKTE